MNVKINIWHVLGLIILIAVIVKQCEQTKVVTKTKTEIVRDTIREVKIKEVPKEVIVNRYIDKEGEKVIVYVDKPNDSTITANQYTTEVKSNDASAELKITTTGELLGVSGIITYPKVETTIETTKNASGLFIYANAPISSNNFSPQLGLMYQFKNTLIIGLGGQYDNFTNNVNATFTIGVKL